MNIRHRITGIISAAALATTLGLVAAPAAQADPIGHTVNVAAAQPAATTLPVTGTLADGTPFSGAISGLDTSVVDGVLMMTGTITGTGLPAGGTTFSAPVQALDTVGCDILNLDLGPLNLDLLGLVIDLSAISLDITAVPGAGNLLGNLLCAIAGLLDGGPLQGITALLDRLLDALGLGA
jgi:hypothetical protein